jgi:predicted dehydrogenase
MAAMKLGKHVYVQKPLTRTVGEARLLTETARKYKVATQMGNQGHSNDHVRMIAEWIADGAIGPVREAHCWTDRPVWPQGVEIERPKDTPPVPEKMDWDLWIGPAPMRPYHPAYHPSIWRGWVDFGAGALGDMGCHIMDAAFYALKLGYPTSVQAFTSTYYEKMWAKVEPKMEIFPRSSIVHYNFPARDGMPPVKLHWYDGGMLPERPDDLEPGRRLPACGTIFVGDKGKILCSTYSENPRIFPETKMRAYKRPQPSIPRIPGGSGGHEQDWIRACKGGEPASSNFDYSGPLTETVVMGNLAIFNPGKKLDWDGKAMKVTNDDRANEFILPPYRAGWSL